MMSRAQMHTGAAWAQTAGGTGMAPPQAGRAAVLATQGAEWAAEAEALAAKEDTWRAEHEAQLVGTVRGLRSTVQQRSTSKALCFEFWLRHERTGLAAAVRRLMCKKKRHSGPSQPSPRRRTWPPYDAAWRGGRRHWGAQRRLRRRQSRRLRRRYGSGRNWRRGRR